MSAFLVRAKAGRELVWEGDELAPAMDKAHALSLAVGHGEALMHGFVVGQFVRGELVFERKICGFCGDPITGETVEIHDALPGEPVVSCGSCVDVERRPRRAR